MRLDSSSQRGVTLVEILVTMVLLAIGLLGLAGLQLRGMQVNQGSAMRSMAAIMAEDLADRMRADVAAARPGAAGGGFYGAFAPAAVLSASPAAMQDWLQANLARLPGGVAATGASVPCSGGQLPCVNVQALAVASIPTPVQIDVYWNDARAASSAREAQANQVGSFHMVAEISSQY